MITTKAQAIQTALTGDWKAAIAINEQILKEIPDDIETLNRLAFAFCALGKAKNAKIIYQRVLKLDSQNPIALKNLKRLVQADKSHISPAAYATHLTPHMDNMFLEENGKTKVVELVNIAQSNVVNTLITGELLSLRVKRLKIFVLNEKQQYVGMLPDDIGKRLIKFINGGNIYETYVKASDNKRITIFIKEIKRMTRFKNQPSFTNVEKSKIKLANKTFQDGKDEETSEDVEESS